MARIRTIKPDFWTNEKVTACSILARLFFIGLWNFADDYGRLVDRPITLKNQIFPGDHVTPDDIHAALTELEVNKLLFRYQVDGKDYLQISGWDNQVINRISKSKLPGPPDDNHAPLTEDSPLEGKGREGKGEGRESSVSTIESDTARPEQPRVVPIKASEKHPGYSDAYRRIEAFLNSPSCTHFGLIDNWLKAGADLEMDILPTLTRMRSEWSGSTLRYFDAAVLKAAAVRIGSSPSGQQPAQRPIETEEGNRALLERKARIFNKGVRFDETTPADIQEMLRLNLTTQEQVDKMSFAA